MEYRPLGRTGWNVSSVSMGCWAIGGAWGDVDDRESMATLRRAVESGINFFDTADVYGDGRSERLLARLRKDIGDEFHVATKIGRRLVPHVATGYTKETLTAFVEESLRNLETEALDLVQLHCPPPEVYYMPEVFEVMDTLVQAGKILYYGVSVEKVEEAIKAIAYPNVQTVQIIFNMFRQRPAELFFRLAGDRQVGILARVPLASGLLTGKLTKGSRFPGNDHRHFNRSGEAFDRGETFSGVEFETGLQAVEELKSVCPPGMTLTQFALRWVLMFEEVSCAIPGAKHPQQIEDNARAAKHPPLPEDVMDEVRQVYDRYVRRQVHDRW